MVEIVKEGSDECEHDFQPYSSWCDGLHMKCAKCDREICYYEG